MEDDDQTRKSPIPVPPIPDFWPGNGEGIPLPDSAGTGNRGPETGNRGPAGGTPGISWSECHAPLACCLRLTMARQTRMCPHRA